MATAAPLEPSGDFLAPGGPDFLRRGDALRAGKLGNDKRSILRVELERFFLVIVEDLDVMRVPISEPVALMVCGGVLYSVGAIVYATKKPDPWPDTFGFHEIFHAFVIAGCACFAATIWICSFSPLATFRKRNCAVPNLMSRCEPRGDGL